MEKLVEEFVIGLSVKSQDLIKNKLFVKNVIDKFLVDHEGKFFINDLGNQREANGNRFIGELNLSEIELFVIQGFLLAQIKKQKEVVRQYGYHVESMEEVGFISKDINNAKKEHKEENKRLTTLFEEYDETANSANLLIWQRLESEIDVVLEKEPSLKKSLFRYNAFRLSNSPGLIFRVYDKDKIILDNIYVPGGD